VRRIIGLEYLALAGKAGGRVPRPSSVKVSPCSVRCMRRCLRCSVIRRITQADIGKLSAGSVVDCVGLGVPAVVAGGGCACNAIDKGSITRALPGAGLKERLAPVASRARAQFRAQAAI
jgi:hypothetical protein